MINVGESNPFAVHRPELMVVRDIVDFFVPPHFFSDIIGNKPIMLVGARGTGKTTLLKYLSYESQKEIYGDSLLNEIRFIGTYWRVDVNYVNGYQKSNIQEEEWIKIFGHNINLTICQELCKNIINIQDSFNCINNEELICREMSEEFYFNSCSSFKNLYELLKREKRQLEKYINNIGLVERPLLSMLEKGHQTFCNLLAEERVFKNVCFYFLIDEYENLLEYQQKIINSFIKHSTYPYSFKVCRRSKGDKTHQTLSETEFISDTDDYSLIDLSVHMSDKNKFTKFAENVCNKRLEKILNLNNNNSTNITFYLPGLKPVEEAKLLEKNRKLPYLNKFREFIKNDSSIFHENRESVLDEFLNEENPIVKRLCFAILQRGKINVNKLLVEYRKYKNGVQSDFTSGKEWLHNCETGILFLLCSEYEKQKLYCGFETFVHLSHGIIRYILELCSVTFSCAFQEGFSLSDPKPINQVIQNNAARHVSQKRLSLIETYQPNGHILKTLALSLGNLFKQFHKDPKQSEPEKNQFTTEIDQLDNDIKKILDYAVMWSVLNEVKSTKDKSKTDLKNKDYFLHPIYSPNFQISPRSGRKIKLSPEQVKKLFLEGENSRKEVYSQLFKNKSNPKQITLFEGGDEYYE